MSDCQNSFRRRVHCVMQRQITIYEAGCCLFWKIWEAAGLLETTEDYVNRRQPESGLNTRPTLVFASSSINTQYSCKCQQHNNSATLFQTRKHLTQRHPAHPRSSSNRVLWKTTLVGPMLLICQRPQFLHQQYQWNHSIMYNPTSLWHANDLR